MHVVITTRADPPLPIARLRGRGQLIELRQTDLRFSLEEATAFLNRVMGLGLLPEDVTALTSRTEGWITGLQMAALALQAALTDHEQDKGQLASFVQAFTGSNRFVLDYFVEEVLQRQPEHIQRFLLQTSVLDRLTGPLCDALLAPQDRQWDFGAGEAPSSASVVQVPFSSLQSPSQQILENLEAANLFIIPLDSERRWYRYHRLFSDLLRKRLQHIQPEQERTLYSRASAWYEQNGYLAEAIDHALAAQEYERAADLIEQVADATLMRSEVSTLTGWIEMLPDDLVQARPSLCLSHAWALLWSGQPLEAIESRLQAVGMDGDANSIRSIPVRAFLATWQGRVSRASALTQEALEQLPEDESFLRSIAAWNLGMSYMVSGDFEAGQQIFDQAIRLAKQTGNVMIAVSALCHLADFSMSQANLPEAESLFKQALQLATDEHGQRRPIAGMPLIGLGELAREGNDLETATRHLLQGIEQISEWGEFGALDGYLSLARVRQAQGDQAGARDLLRKAEQIAVQFDVTEFDDLLVTMHQVRLWLAQGNTRAAISWFEDQGYSLDKAQDPTLSKGLPSLAKQDGAAKSDADLSVQGAEGVLFGQQLRRYEALLLARTLLLLDRPMEALPLLKAHQEMLARHGRSWSRRMIEVQTLSALAHQAVGNLDEALTSLEAALVIAESGGFVRILIDEGEPMLQLLRQAATRGIAPEYTSKLVAAFEQPDRAALASAPTDSPQQLPSLQPLVEPLSERELEVLRLLAIGLSNPEIAQRLFIATSTVRSHLKNIYGKLNVHRRWDAVHRAEELGLL
jgi:LuxR family maltose regulon positive regulatory protein